MEMRYRVMRDILFRGRRIDNDEWVYGSFCMDALEQFNGLCGVDGFIRLYDKTKCKMQSYEVDRETVGQYTGMKDKNGKRIFEGDIIDCWSEGVNAKGTVQQRIDGLWIIHPAWQNHIVWGICPDKFGNTTVEIIGNIHDNPELLKEGADNG